MIFFLIKIKKTLISLTLGNKTVGPSLSPGNSDSTASLFSKTRRLTWVWEVVVRERPPLTQEFVWQDS